MSAEIDTDKPRILGLTMELRNCRNCGPKPKLHFPRDPKQTMCLQCRREYGRINKHRHVRL